MPPRTRSSADTQRAGRHLAFRCGAAVLLGLATLAAGTAPASAQSAAPVEGGAIYVAKPKISKVRCVRGCASRRRARAGSTLRLTGSALAGVRTVVFHGSAGREDDITVRVRPSSARRLNVRVPVDAVSGPLSARVSRRFGSRRTRTVAILPAPPPEPNPTLTPVPGPRQSGAPRLETGTSRTRAFIGARRPVRFSFRISDTPSAVRVEVLRARDGSVARSWAPSVAPGSVSSVVWDGRIGRRQAPLGRYSFRLTVAGRSGATARSAQSTDFTRDAFDLFDHVFPVPGRHDFGQAGARFGAGRAGHTHQGQDVPARCGSRMVAARGGRVKAKAYHAAAGNYLVIDGAGTGTDYAYMHLAEPTPFAVGDRVYTGQRVGAVGETGDARGCHLHFELWSAPGWYSGGSPFDPLPSLRAWDRWS